MRRAAPKRVGRLFALLLMLVLGVQCSEELAPTGAPGGVGLVYREPAGLGGRPDSLRLWVSDRSGDLILGPLAGALAGDGSVDLEVAVASGDGYALHLQLHGTGPVDRGVLAEGMATGVRVRAAGTTEVEIPLRSTFPRMHPTIPAPGDLEYRVAWRALPTAESYVLEETVGGDLHTIDTEDTFRVVSAAALGDDAVSYRVRAVLQRGASVRSDAIVLDLGEVRDLPRIIAVSPSDGATNLFDDIEPVITFDRPMDWSTLDGALRVVDETTAEPFPVEALAVTGSSSVQLAHEDAFLRGRVYRLEIDPTVLGLDGRPLDQSPETQGLQGFESRFGIEVYDPLQVVAVAPENGATGVGIGAEVTLDFGRAVDPASVNAETVRWLTAGGAPVAVARTLENGDRRVRLRPATNLAYGAAYVVEVTTGVLDLRGEPLDQDPATPIPVYEPFSSGFLVEPQPVGARVDAIEPLAAEANAPPFGTIRVTFSRPIDPATVTAAGSFSVRKLPIDANIQGSVTHDAARRVFTFDPNDLLEQGTSYRVVLSTAVKDDEGVPLDQDPDTPGFQPFESTFRAERNLQVVTVKPVSGADRVLPEAEVELTFNLAVDPASLDASTVVFETGGTAVPATRVLRNGNRTAAIVPIAPLDRFRRYDVRVEPELRSFEGSRLDMNLGIDGYQRFASFFTTAPESLPPRVVESIPPNGALEVVPRPELSVRFNKPIKPASVTADNFYLRVRSSGALVPGARIVTSDSLVARFVVINDLSFERAYELVVTNWIVDRFDVRLDQDPVAPGRQEFVLGFTTDHEMESPRVEQIVPADGAENVLPTATVVVDFNEAMAPASVVSAFSLRDVDLDLVIEGAGSMSADSTRYTFTPAVALLRDHGFAVRVETSATDRVGNPLDQDPLTKPREPFESAFRTQPDVVGPRVLGSDPADGADQVTIEVQPTFTFDEPIDPASLNGVVLQESGAEVPLAERMMESATVVRIIPAAPLDFDTEYTLVAEGVVDSLGNLLDQDPGTAGAQRFEAVFRTQVETIPPRVLALVLESVPAPIGAPLRIVFDEPMDPTTLEGGIRLSRGAVDLAVSLDPVAPDTVVVTPLELLAYDALHTVEVSGVTDLVGNVLDQNPGTPEPDEFSAQFRTERDTIAPRVIEVDPMDGASGVPTDVIVAVTFSEPMNPATFAFGDLSLSRLGFDVILEPLSWNDEQTIFYMVPLDPLQDGSIYDVQAGRQLEDVAGNDLDQDPDTPIAEEFHSSFIVGTFPVADAGGGICSDTPLVVVDARGSHDPDGTLVLLTVDWGDGTVEMFANPDSMDMLLAHAYACLDFRGCDLIDNDGDGALDEGGSAGCDESYRIIVTVRDDDAFTDADSLGVSFCAFGPLGTEPPDGANNVDLDLAEVRIRLTRPVASESLTGDRFELLGEGIDPVTLSSITTEEGGTVVVLTLGEPLAGSLEYQIRVSGTVTDTEGVRFDPVPCTPAFEPYVSTFTTEVAPRRPGRASPDPSGSGSTDARER